jgi:hypothetical protein
MPSVELRFPTLKVFHTPFANCYEYRQRRGWKTFVITNLPQMMPQLTILQGCNGFSGHPIMSFTDASWPLLEKVDLRLIHSPATTETPKLVETLVAFGNSRPNLTHVTIASKYRRGWTEFEIAEAEFISAIISSYNALQSNNQKHERLRSLLVNVHMAAEDVFSSCETHQSALEAAVELACRNPQENSTNMDRVAWFLARPELDRLRLVVAASSNAILVALQAGRVQLALQLLSHVPPEVATTPWTVLHKRLNSSFCSMPQMLTFDEIVNAAKDDAAKAQVTTKLVQLHWPRIARTIRIETL